MIKPKPILIFLIIFFISSCTDDKYVVNYITNYELGASIAKKSNKNILLIFDSLYNPTNSTINFLTDKKLGSVIEQNYVVILLMLDNSNKYNDSITYGEYNVKLRDDKFSIKDSPLYYILNSNEDVLKGPLYYCEKDEFIKFLKLESSQ